MLARIVAAGLGLGLLMAVATVYENEEKALQSRLEEWWVRLSDVEPLAIETHERMWRTVLSTIFNLLQVAFGVNARSWQLAAVGAAVATIGVFVSPLGTSPWVAEFAPLDYVAWSAVLACVTTAACYAMVAPRAARPATILILIIG